MFAEPKKRSNIHYFYVCTFVSLCVSPPLSLPVCIPVSSADAATGVCVCVCVCMCF